MRQHVRTTVAMAILAVCCSTVLAEETPTLESVEKQIDEVWAKVNSFTAKTSVDSKVPFGPMTMTSTGTGRVEFLKVEGEPRFRMEMVNKLGANIPLPGGAGEQKILGVFDGKNFYQQIEALGMKKVFKGAPEESGDKGPYTGKNALESLRKKGVLRLLPEEIIEGAPVYVIEVTPNAEVIAKSPMKYDKMLAYIAKDSGIQIQLLAMDGDNAVMSMRYSDIQLNVPIEESHFVFVAPPGTPIEDMSKGLPGLRRGSL